MADRYVVTDNENNIKNTPHGLYAVLLIEQYGSHDTYYMGSQHSMVATYTSYNRAESFAKRKVGQYADGPYPITYEIVRLHPEVWHG